MTANIIKRFGLVLAAIVACSTASANAQQGVSLPSNGGEFASQVTASVGTHCAPDFFVVDSTPCPQTFNGCPPLCRGIVQRYLPDERYHVSDAETLIASIRPGVPVCIAIHGSFVRTGDLYPESVARYKRIVASANDRPLHFIAAHWPSDPGPLLLPSIQVNALGRRAEFNGIYVAQLINRIPPENPVALIGHSHGCRVVASALHLLGGGTVNGIAVTDPCPNRRIRAVFTAAAIDHHWLNPGEKYGCAINRIECLLNVRNQNDLVLKLYPLREPLLHHAIGQSGFRHRDLVRIGSQSQKLAELDVTHLVGTSHMIAKYAVHPQIRAAVVPYLYFD